MKGKVSATDTNVAKGRNKKLTFNNNSRFRSCMSKINNTLVDSGEDLDIIMPMNKVLEHNNNYLWHQQVFGIIIKMK